MNRLFAIPTLSIACLAWVQTADAADVRTYAKTKNFDDLTSSEHTAAKATAQRSTLRTLRACADPGNMPLSNNKAEGFQNKIAAVLAKALGGDVNFFWRPYIERGLTRETFENNECDVLLDMPVDSDALLTTEPIYRSTYVLVSRTDRNYDFKSLDDPRLKELRIGVFQHSGMREAFKRRGISSNVAVHIITAAADLNPATQPWRQVQRVVDGELDVAAVWGPFAGWLKTMKGAPLTITPVNIMEDQVPMEFELAIGMRKNDVVLKYMLDNALKASKDEIAQILADYGVPLVECSKCAVQGDIPAHGSYMHKLRGLANVNDRFLKQAQPLARTGQESADQIVDQGRLDQWLTDGADLNEELSGAIVGNDATRVAFLLGKGADVNAQDKQGYAPVQNATRNRNAPLISLLSGKGADVNARDSDGYTALMHAINRNHVPAIEALAKGGADLQLGNTNGITPLELAIGDGKLYAARALLELGAKPDGAFGPDGISPLMVVATQRPAKTRAGQVSQTITSVELAKVLLDQGANVNATSKAGITALMIAAGHNNAPMIGLLLSAGADPAAKDRKGETALDIARKALNDDAIGALRFLATPPTPASPPQGELHN